MRTSRHDDMPGPIQANIVGTGPTVGNCRLEASGGGDLRPGWGRYTYQLGPPFAYAVVCEGAIVMRTACLSDHVDHL